jgi:uncharacterized protein YndB with AHSA1/START domain
MPILLGVLLGLVVLVLVFAAVQPNTFVIQRKAVMRAPAKKIFAYFNDFKTWNKWSPWEKADPAMKKTFSGKAKGLGSVYAWEGNQQIGQGRMEIIEVSAPKLLKIKLDFFKPFEAHNLTTFTLEASGKMTEVSWTMQGPSRFMMKVMHLFMNMDRMVGKDFEKGLAQLKSLVEK